MPRISGNENGCLFFLLFQSTQGCDSGARGSWVSSDDLGLHLTILHTPTQPWLRQGRRDPYERTRFLRSMEVATCHCFVIFSLFSTLPYGLALSPEKPLVSKGQSSPVPIRWLLCKNPGLLWSLFSSSLSCNWGLSQFFYAEPYQLCSRHWLNTETNPSL